MQILRYRTRGGGQGDFDISDNACEKFGFHHGDEVETPLGPAKVVGVRKGYMWFHIDGQDGASNWSYTSKDQYKTEGFKIIKLAIEKTSAVTAERILDCDDADVQINLIRNLDADSEDGQEILEKVALKSSFWQARQVAVRRLNPDIHAETLVYINMNDDDEDVQQEAKNRFNIERYTESVIEIALQRNDGSALLEALDHISRENHGDILIKIAQHADSWRARQKAVSMLHPNQHSDVLKSIVRNDDDEDVRDAANNLLLNADNPEWLSPSGSAKKIEDHDNKADSSEEMIKNNPPIEPRVVEKPVESEEDRKARLEKELQVKLALIRKETNIKKIVRFCTDETDDEIRLAALAKIDPEHHARQIEKCLKRGSEAVQLAALELIDLRFGSFLIGKLSQKATFESVRLAAIGKLDPVLHKYILEKIVKKDVGEIKAVAKRKLAA